MVAVRNETANSTLNKVRMGGRRMKSVVLTRRVKTTATRHSLQPPPLVATVVSDLTRHHKNADFLICGKGDLQAPLACSVLNDR